MALLRGQESSIPGRRSSQAQFDVPEARAVPAETLEQAIAWGSPRSSPAQGGGDYQSPGSPSTASPPQSGTLLYLISRPAVRMVIMKRRDTRRGGMKAVSPGRMACERRTYALSHAPILIAFQIPSTPGVDRRISHSNAGV